MVHDVRIAQQFDQLAVVRCRQHDVEIPIGHQRAKHRLAGSNAFDWNGKGADGTQWPDGAYTVSVSATNANGQSVPVTTQASGVVSAVDVTKSPPALTVGNQSYTLSQIASIS